MRYSGGFFAFIVPLHEDKKREGRNNVRSSPPKPLELCQ